METYVFYLYRAGDIYMSFEAHGISPKESVTDQAKKILRQRPLAEYVVVKCNDVVVATEHQAPQI
jgi:hypothetical protein